MDVVHASVITDLGCLLSGLAVSACRIPASVISDMDAPMRSLGGRTVPDGAVGILPAFMMVVAGCHYVDFC